MALIQMRGCGVSGLEFFMKPKGEIMAGSAVANSPGSFRIERRMARASRNYTIEDIADLLGAAQEAIANDMRTQAQLVDEAAQTLSALGKWQAIHRYIRAAPYRDDPDAPRSRQWQGALALARALGDLDLIEWVVDQIDLALAAGRRGARNEAEEDAAPTYLVLLKSVANRRRKARAALKWLETAREKGWSTCDSSTLGANLILLHAASVHSRDNPLYFEPCDGAHDNG
jgi:hypothetical protein